MKRKAILAVINGNIHIDPSDVGTVNIEVIKSQIFKATGKTVGVKIEPIKKWMPISGTEALMKEAIKDMNLHKK